MKKITIPLSEEDLEELRNGESFEWTFDGVEVHLVLESFCDSCELNQGECECNQ